MSTPANRQRNLVLLQIYRSVTGFIVYLDRINFRGAQRTLNVQLNIGRVIDHIDIFVAQLPHNPMNTGPLHPNAGSNRIDAVVIGLHRYFGPFSRFPDDFLDGNQSVEYLGDLQFEQPFQEVGSRPRENDPRRSEEHTSELQSLMRISYAVFCLKKKNTINTTNTKRKQLRQSQHEN